MSASGTAIVFASGKGGTGKTSVAGGVASCLAALGKTVLCIDADTGLRNLDIALGMSDLINMNIEDVIKGRAGIVSAAAAHPVIKNLYLLTSPSEGSPDDFTGRQMNALVTRAKSLYDYVIIDAPAGVERGFLLAAAYADRAVIVATCDLASLRDAEKAERRLEALGIEQRELIVNRVTRRMLYNLEMTIDNAMDEVGLPLLGVVPEDEYVMLAACRQVPLILCRKKGAILAYKNIARRIIGETAPLMRIR